MDWGISMFSDENLFVIVITLFATYFIFELNNGSLSQLKELKTSVTRLKKNRSDFREDFLIPYIEDKESSAFITIYTLYLLFLACIFMYILFQGGFIFYVFITSFLFWIVFISFPLDNDELPIYKAVIGSRNMIEFLEQLDIKEGSEEFNRIIELYNDAESEEATEKKIELMDKVVDELPY